MHVDFGSADSVPDGEGRCVTHEGRKYALFRAGGTIQCLDNSCTHMGGPLCEGRLEGAVVQCPWHGSKFDVRNGQVVGPPARQPVRSHPAKIEDGRIWVDLE